MKPPFNCAQTTWPVHQSLAVAVSIEGFEVRKMKKKNARTIWRSCEFNGILWHRPCSSQRSSEFTLNLLSDTDLTGLFNWSTSRAGPFTRRSSLRILFSANLRMRFSDLFLRLTNPKETAAVLIWVLKPGHILCNSVLFLLFAIASLLDFPQNEKSFQISPNIIPHIW